VNAQAFSINGQPSQAGVSQWNNGANGVISYNNGNVGVGTTVTNAKLQHSPPPSIRWFWKTATAQRTRKKMAFQSDGGNFDMLAAMTPGAWETPLRIKPDGGTTINKTVFPSGKRRRGDGQSVTEIGWAGDDQRPGLSANGQSFTGSGTPQVTVEAGTTFAANAYLDNGTGKKPQRRQGFRITTENGVLDTIASIFPVSKPSAATLPGQRFFTERAERRYKSHQDRSPSAQNRLNDLPREIWMSTGSW